MNIPKHEQRVLHVLAQGGAIHFERAANGKVQEVSCYILEGHILADYTLPILGWLLKQRFIRSLRSAPYRVTKRGLEAVRAQIDNR